MDANLPLDTILHGDCLDLLPKLPERSVDLVFADPPYNLQLQKTLFRPNMTRVDAVDEDWDKFSSFEEYDRFTRQWLEGCRRVLKDAGALWVIGSYHNIYRIGTILQDLGFWLLNDVAWIKTNPMPNFRGVRFTNAHETLLWASRAQGSRYTFNHHAMKALNEDKQMRSDWLLPVCGGRERLKENGRKAHPTQKPEALLYRVLLATSQPGDIVLDPFMGTGTTAIVARKLHRRFVGIEREEKYIRLATKRLAAVTPELFDESLFDVRDSRWRAPRLPFSALLEAGLLQPGQLLYFKADRDQAALVRPDGKLVLNGWEGSIHQVGHKLSGAPCNGWEHWYYETPEGELQAIDILRRRLSQP